MDGTKNHTHVKGIDAKGIRSAAAGKWREILPAVTGIDRGLLDGKHYPCPKCGGKDRFRAFDDVTETGGTICNQCFNKENGDGFSAIMWLTGCSFPEAVKLVADHLGLKADGNRRNGKPEGKAIEKSARLAENIAKLDSASPSVRDIRIQTYCRSKPPITPEGIRRCGGVPVRGCSQHCIRLDGYTRIGDKEPSAVVLLRVDGRPFPPLGSLQERKTHTLGGSVNSWLTSGMSEDIQQAHTIIDVEGVPDLLAAASMLPPGWVAVTNMSGAKARGKLPRKWAEGKRVIVVGDADEPGQEGARRAVLAHQKAGVEVFVAKLPYPIEETHGKDLRDWLNEGNKLEDLPTEPVTPEQVEEWSEKANKKIVGGREIAVDTDESRVIDEAISP